MGKIAKVTDLTKLEGDPHPRRADVLNPRLYLEFHARGPFQVGLIKAVVRCSERAPVARAVVVSMLLAVGLGVAAFAHFILTGVTPAWIGVSVSLVLVFAPGVLYWAMARRSG